MCNSKNIIENKILIVSNAIDGLISFRYELINELVNKNNDVYIMAPTSDKSHILEKIGCNIVRLDFDLHGKNLFKEAKLLFEINKYVKENKPNYILTFTIKPNIYIGWINKVNKNFIHLANITGLGHSIMSPKYKLIGDIMLKVYASALNKSKIVFVQNKMIYKKMRNTNKMINLHTIPGSGVNTQKYYYRKLSFVDNERTITYLGRIIESKGIFELLSAIEKLNNLETNFNYKFIIVGNNNLNIKTKLLNVTIENEVEDVRNILLKSHVIINPSHHEGMSNILLEGGSMGRMLMSSKIPGCEEITGEYGITFEEKNSESLLEALKYLDTLTNEDLTERGLKIRKHVENNFSRDLVINEYLDAIGINEEEHIDE